MNIEINCLLYNTVYPYILFLTANMCIDKQLLMHDRYVFFLTCKIERILQ
ncbi:hypothetical protein SAMN04515679_1694 [Pelosinus fermentans]|uniref:Uncharacterized protein n=1 Tax=Pelosinus fermentans B4 TaxID=1149862 RepID=I9LK75_9FIRM|nr:hypothetical protein FB4_2023 [Pelosinus fermentans B4]EIW25344.1 hypothetical protein FA11_2503 [Pelosinus fermentans A11]OAM93602.1 hypothetical protein FR7_01619 [Pelosinus fermentans DSM 17108]SDQ83546.1 hypothetical protein SAMN04515679_1694 [Pelosinus fermentans]